VLPQGPITSPLLTAPSSLRNVGDKTIRYIVTPVTEDIARPIDGQGEGPPTAECLTSEAFEDRAVKLVIAHERESTGRQPVDTRRSEEEGRGSLQGQRAHNAEVSVRAAAQEVAALAP
jgi:hypothetical protein